MGALRNGLAKIRWSLHHRGLLGTIRAGTRKLRRRQDTSNEVIVHPFDRHFGVDTSGFITAVHLATGHPHDLFSTGYCGVAPSRFRAILDFWLQTPTEHPVSDYAFIDIGCGKGRALLLAAQYPFREIIGVELNSSLVETAQANLELWRTVQHPPMPLRALHQDATEFELPSGPSLLFLYAPFAESILRKFIDHVEHTLSAQPLPLDILYCNAPNDHFLANHSRYTRLWTKSMPIAADDVAANPSADSAEPCTLYRHAA